MSMCLPYDLPYGWENAAVDLAIVTVHFTEGLDNYLRGKQFEIPEGIFQCVKTKIFPSALGGRSENYYRLGRMWKRDAATRDLFRRMLESLNGSLSEGQLDEHIVRMRDLSDALREDPVSVVNGKRKEYSRLRGEYGWMYGASVQHTEDVHNYRAAVDDDD